MKHYLFFTRHTLPLPRADLVQVVNCANAAANLGYSTVLTYLRKAKNGFNPIEWLAPFHPNNPDESLAKFYNMQEKLKVSALPVFTLDNRSLNRWFNPSTVVSKYYFPIHLRPVTQLVHTRDWNFIKAAIKYGIPAIYEHHHYEQKQFEPNIVNHPLFQIAVTVADTVREDMIQNGMPSGKVIKLHNGFNRSFLIRYPQPAKLWREKLLANWRSHLVVYSGALHSFKGVDLMMDVAKELPFVQFVFAGGDANQVNAYEQLAADKQLGNVKFLGYVLHEQLASLLQAADILVHPHCSGIASTFTSPLKFFDYMASGTPIVATEIAPLMEFKPFNVVSGWCEPDNPVKLAECIQRVLETHPRKLEGYINTIDFVQQFSWENRIEKILSYVDEPLRQLVKIS
ncbi:MAG: glycosyltransferase family 4 protein [Cyanobacteria bacterium RU_5_0]|nr:glycosyltransferase family 4 protein [Cyanobacteria bacterium RU_5_0]